MQYSLFFYIEPRIKGSNIIVLNALLLASRRTRFGYFVPVAGEQRSEIKNRHDDHRADDRGNERTKKIPQRRRGLFVRS